MASARICLTHEEGSSLCDDAALAPVIIFLTQKVEEGNLEQGRKTMLKPEELPHWAKGPILARRAIGRVATLGEGANFGEKGGGDLVGEEASAAPRF